MNHNIKEWSATTKILTSKSLEGILTLAKKDYTTIRSEKEYTCLHPTVYNPNYSRAVEIAMGVCAMHV